MLPRMLSDKREYFTPGEHDLPDEMEPAESAAIDMFGGGSDDFDDEFSGYRDLAPKDHGRPTFKFSDGSELWAFIGHDAWFWDGQEWMSDPDNDDQ